MIPPSGVPTPPPEEGNNSKPITRIPSYTVAKDTNDTPENVGDTLVYTFTVANTGNVNLTDINVTDVKCASAITLTSESLTADTVLEVAETQVYSCNSIPVTQAEVDAGVVNNEVSITVVPPPGVPTPPPVEGNLSLIHI